MKDLFEFTTEEKEFLKNVGSTPSGQELIHIFRRVVEVVGQLDAIEGDYGAQVEGRKIARATLKKFTEAMKQPRMNRAGFPQGEDDEEYV